MAFLNYNTFTLIIFYIIGSMLCYSFFTVPIWRRRRQILVPTFSPKIVDSYVKVFAKQGEKLRQNLAQKSDKGSFASWSELSAYTLDSVSETTMGVNITTEESNLSFLAALKYMLNLVCKRIFHLWLQPECLFKLFPEYTSYQKNGHIIRSFVDKIVQAKREEIKTRKQLYIKNFDLKNYEEKTFLELLVILSGGEKGYSPVELREEILTLIVAGTDTSAVAIGNTLKLLAQYPKIQEKVYEEIHEIVGDTERLLQKEDLLRLKYLEMVIKESLRLFPPVPFIVRKVETDIKIPSGAVLPAGSGVIVSIWGVHRNPKYWGPDAEHFDPQRFLPERYTLLQSSSFMPFGGGPRNCVGYQYAMFSMKAALASVLRSYRVVGEERTSPIPYIRVKLDIMMKAVDDYELVLERRK